MNWKQKLSSRKFWVALAGLAVGVIALLGIKTDTSQITGVIMALGSVIAYIFGEGYVDAASAGADTIINGNPTVTAGQQATTPPSTPVVDTVDPAPAEGAPTGSAQAAEIKQDTALAPESEAVAPVTNGAA